jgi:nucleoside-diphosphate-sugar epimerase
MGLRGKRILVTGARGFVGQHLSSELRRQGAEVLTLAEGNGHSIDVRDWRKISGFGTTSGSIDLIYHLASLMFVPYSFQEPREIYEVNVLGTLNILELCRLHGIPRIVFASSYVYGQPSYLPIDEAHPLNPNNPYARSKVFGEGLCRAYHEDYGISCIILRSFNLYGEGQRAHFLIPSILSQLGRRQIELKDPDPKRDYLYISDAINAYVKAGEYDKSHLDVFNIGAGVSYAVSDIVNRVLQVWGEETTVKYQHQTRRGEIMDVVANIRKAKQLLGWQPEVSFEEGIQRCLEWYRDQHSDDNRQNTET